MSNNVVCVCGWGGTTIYIYICICCCYDFWLCFIIGRLKTLSNNHEQISGEKAWKNIVKGSRNGNTKKRMRTNVCGKPIRINEQL